MLSQVQIFNAWLTKSLKENQRMLAQARDDLRQVRELNAKLSARIKAAGK